MLTFPYRLHAIRVNELSILDLRTREAQEIVGLEIDDVSGEDWSACQAVGHAAWFLEMSGVLAPSAGSVGLVIAAFETRADPGQIKVAHSVDLTPQLYRRFSDEHE